jgi:hypothetical protein
MNVEIGAEVVLFPEKENMNGIFVAVYFSSKREEAVFTFRQNGRTREGAPHPPALERIMTTEEMVCSLLLCEDGLLSVRGEGGGGGRIICRLHLLV